MKELKFVDIGEGITEGHIKEWLVKDGDSVKEDQPLVQIETDKAVVSIPSPVSGKAKIVAKIDTDVKVGDVLAQIDDGSSSSAAEAPVTKAATAMNEVMQKQTGKPQEQAVKEVLATPAVRHLATQLGIDLSTIVGTGPNGRILENDLKAVAAKPKPVPGYSEIKEEQHGEEVERMPMTQIRKAIARNMELSWTIPRATHMDLIDATHISNILTREKPNAEKLGVKLTLLPFVIKAVVQALKENPRFNASYDRDKQEIILKKYYNIGIAAEGEDGLRVLVIKGADRKSIMELAKEIRVLGSKVKDKSIKPEEMSDSTFTITNIGSLGGGFLSVPMINYPDVAILGIHLVREMPVVREGKVIPGKVLPFSLVFDHRVVDGAEAVRFGNALKSYLEDPEFLEMI
ncbi:MAG: 2-oxo acid dehydrogenase subunit E2 [Candidatus Marsarchaeota archaeon]|jgi:pyruvate dehydrogenase E2 component (dihydrolipoamide acetyltransferase)|nr:2-oxo acid dehydrogenase subunit E2 [Candidatus Marsarchaeota archaeon]